MLFLEAPVGVGFSYHTSQDYRNNDNRTASENKQAIELFYSLYPEFKNNPLFLTGESYAGIYVPTLAEEILRAVDVGTYTGADLKGIAVGNGCTGNEIGICGWYYTGICQGMYYSMKFLLDLPFIRQSLKDQITTACDWNACKNNITADSYLVQLSSDCLNLLDVASVELGEINIYNVYGSCIFDSCEGPGDGDVAGRGDVAGHRAVAGRVAGINAHANKINNIRSQLNQQQQLFAMKQQYQQQSNVLTSTLMETENQYEFHSIFAQRESHSFDIHITSSNATNNSTNATDDRPRGPVGCIDSGTATNYLMQQSVQKAIHVIDPGYCWGVCNQAAGFEYNSTRPNLPRDTYPYLISRIKVLVYNGDWDACVPYTDNAGWTESMGYETMSPWKTWFYRAQDNSTQIGGYSVVYNTTNVSVSTLSSFEFRTVRGAGHMVPTDTPLQGLAVLSHLLGINEDHHLYDIETNGHQENESCLQNNGHRVWLMLLITVVFLLLTGILLYQARELKRFQNGSLGVESQGIALRSIVSSGSSGSTVNSIHTMNNGQSLESVVQNQQCHGPSSEAGYFRVSLEAADEESSSSL